MTDFRIHNISFELDELSIIFSYTKGYDKNSWGKAYLQLPDTPDSRHLIDNLESGEWEKEQQEVFHQLCDYYFDSFKDIECAAASAALGVYINHVESVDAFFVAFSANDCHVLVDSPYQNLYNKEALFSKPFPDSYGDYPEEVFIEKAKKQYFDALSRQLTNEMNDYFEDVISGKTLYSQEIIDQGFDEILHDFMKKEFEKNSNDYMSDDIALKFYESFGCDIRGDYEERLMQEIEKINDQQ
jgi:hypothetical protein